MDISLRLLNVPAFRKLWDVCDASAFVHDFSVFFKWLYFEQVSRYYVYVSPDGESMIPTYVMDCQLANIVTWRYFNKSRKEIRYEADDAMLEMIEKILYFWDSCEKHLQYYSSRGWRTWWRDMRRCQVINRHMRETSLVLSRQELWAAMIALFVRKGFGTAEDFARMVQDEK